MAVTQDRPTATPLDVARIRADFPILERTTPDGRPLVYLDSRGDLAEAERR